MSISKRILDEIEKLDLTPKEKNVLLDILDIEDSGIYKYTSQYEKIIQNYIKHNS